MIENAFRICVVSGIIWTYYRLVCANKPSHAFNRIILLMAIPFSTLVLYPRDLAFVGTFQLEALSTWTSEAAIYSPLVNNSSWLLYIYVIGVCLSFGIFLFQLWRVFVLFSNSRKTTTGYYEIAQSASPCTFLSWIFIPKGLPSPEQKAILLHEQAHVRMIHGIDLLLINIYQIFFWWNPFAYLIKNSLKTVHEFQADKKAAEKCDNYAECVLSFQKWKQRLSLVSSINPLFIHLKNRLTMLNQTSHTGRIHLFKLLIIPILAASFFIAGCQKVAEPAPYNGISEVDKMPSFKGGTEALYAYIGKNLKYPEIEKAKHIEGKVYVEFVVEKNGAITKPKILRADNKNFEMAALDIIKTMPDWNPGNLDGNDVAVKMILPFNFKLSS